MIDTHIPGHLQALVKNNICIVVLSFPDYDKKTFLETFKNFDYDVAIDLGVEKQNASVGDSWNGQVFSTKPYESWTLDNSGNWKAPIEKTIDSHIWYEEHQLWAEPLITEKDDSTGKKKA